LRGGFGLTYIWEVLLKADEENYPREKIRFTQVTTPSPYMEVAYEELNRNYISNAPVEVNAYYRFSSVFDNVLNELSDYPELQEYLFDILMHYMAEINIREGLNKAEYLSIFLNNDVIAGKFGEHFKEIFQTFSLAQLRFIKECMIRLYSLGASIALFKAVMRQVYPKSLIYLDTVDSRDLLVYIGKKETPELRRQIDFILHLFVAFDYVVHLFWAQHFGIFGVNETLELDEYVVY
jgi:hypothetical protein